MRSVLLALFVLGCGSGGGAGEDPDAAPPRDASESDPFAAVTAALEAGYNSRPADVAGLTLVIFDSNDNRVYEQTFGDFDPDREIPVASASKLVTGLVLLRVVEDGSLSLSSTTGDILGWTGENAAITLDQLGAFVSGMRVVFLCVFNQNRTLEECVDTIGNADLEAPPGTQFEYGNSHHHVAARMAEVATGRTWQQVADDFLFEPLGIKSSTLAYYTAPKDSAGTTNPLVAGGLRATTNQYAEVLKLLFHRGERDGTQLISEALIDRMTQNVYPSATIAGSPYSDSDYDYRYGFSSWLECDGPASACQTVSSAGAFGFVPWVDYENGYYATLAMEGDELDTAANFSVDVQQQLRPLIVTALQ